MNLERIERKLDRILMMLEKQDNTMLTAREIMQILKISRRQLARKIPILEEYGLIRNGRLKILKRNLDAYILDGMK